MMATPQDLEDFAVGFSLTEGVVSSLDAIESVEIVEEEVGIELRIWLKEQTQPSSWAVGARWPAPTGCGLCRHREPDRGHAPAARRAQRPCFHAGPDHDGDQLAVSIAGTEWRTSAAHGARLDARRGLVAVREDVGRHNALDKLPARGRERTTQSKASCA